MRRWKKLDLLGQGAVPPSQNSEDGVHDEVDSVTGTDADWVSLIENGRLESEVVVGGKENETLDEDTADSDGEILAVLEETVVEHAIFLELGLVDSRSRKKSKSDEEWCHDVHIWPLVWCLRPGKTNAEEHQAGRKQKVSDPVELLDLLHLSEVKLRWQRV